ncbi:MAG: hypothetical protein AB7P03_17560 [Kofleriaceae bacterium]
MTDPARLSRRLHGRYKLLRVHCFKLDRFGPHGVAFGRYDVTLRVGKLRDVSGDKPMLPVYGSVSVDARW